MANGSFVEKLNGVNPWLARMFTGAIVAGTVIGSQQLNNPAEVTRQEVHEIVARAPYPWLKDQALVMEKLNRIEEDIEELQDEVDQLRIESARRGGQQ